MSTAMHTDDIRQALQEATERRVAAERERVEAMFDTSTWVRHGKVAGMTVVEMAELTGLSRVTIYAILDS